MQGTVPEELGSAGLLAQVLMSSNRLSGSLPAFFADEEHLLALWLAGNRFSGPIPREWCAEGANNMSEINLSVCPLARCPSATLCCLSALSVLMELQQQCR